MKDVFSGKKPIVFFLCFFLCINLFAKSYTPNFDFPSYIESLENVKVILDDKSYIIMPEIAEDVILDTALIFYPGGYVKYESYIPLLVEIAKQGIMCIMPRMHHDLAIYNINVSNKIISDSKYSEIRHWYIGGHSLGGAMSAVYCKKNADKLEGLVLLAAYSTKDLNNLNIKVLSIYGSCDGVLNLSKYDRYKKYLPKDYVESVLEGGNHSGFGDYGFQRGDGEALMSSDIQKKITAELIGAWVK